MIAPAIELRAVAHDYADGTLALRGVDLRILPGEAVAIVGANGAGKSTLLQHINGLLLPGHGSVSVEGIALSRASLPEVRRRVGYVFQDATLLPWRSVQANVELLAELHNTPKAERAAKAREAEQAKNAPAQVQGKLDDAARLAEQKREGAESR